MTSSISDENIGMRQLKGEQEGVEENWSTSKEAEVRNEMLHNPERWCKKKDKWVNYQDVVDKDGLERNERITNFVIKHVEVFKVIAALKSSKCIRDALCVHRIAF